jgi:putative ABC transport system permease protein
MPGPSITRGRSRNVGIWIDAGIGQRGRRYRIPEIGIRRSFGATSGRVFFTVMMESVCATVVAGLIGVALAVAIVKNLPPNLFNVTDMPPFPVHAAVEGMVAATVVGALAGLLPATVAVRIKVIDAIRY